MLRPEEISGEELSVVGRSRSEFREGLDQNEGNPDGLRYTEDGVSGRHIFVPIHLFLTRVRARLMSSAPDRGKSSLDPALRIIFYEKLS